LRGGTVRHGTGVVEGIRAHRAAGRQHERRRDATDTAAGADSTRGSSHGVHVLRREHGSGASDRTGRTHRRVRQRLLPPPRPGESFRIGTTRTSRKSRRIAAGDAEGPPGQHLDP
jgi:hypothetical protein